LFVPLLALVHNLDCILRKVYGLRMLQLILVVREKLSRCSQMLHCQYWNDLEP
jgi:hypothetical protein